MLYILGIVPPSVRTSGAAPREPRSTLGLQKHPSRTPAGIVEVSQITEGKVGVVCSKERPAVDEAGELRWIMPAAASDGHCQGGVGRGRLTSPVSPPVRPLV